MFVIVNQINKCIKQEMVEINVAENLIAYNFSNGEVIQIVTPIFDAFDDFIIVLLFIP